MKDTWTHILGALSPDYDTFKTMVDKGPCPSCEINKRGSYFTLTINEHWTNGVDNIALFDQSGDFDSFIEWTESQLKTWPNVKRMAYDQWYFKRKRDAEKFKTFFLLTWAK